MRAYGLKTPPTPVEFSYNTGGEDQDFFERQYCWGPVALKGLRLGLSNGFVPLEIQEALEKRYITCLLSKMENRYVLNNILETKRQVAHSLNVTFSDGQQEYQLILGSQAFLIHAELQERWREREQSEL